MPQFESGSKGSSLEQRSPEKDLSSDTSGISQIASLEDFNSTFRKASEANNSSDTDSQFGNLTLTDSADSIETFDKAKPSSALSEVEQDGDANSGKKAPQEKPSAQMLPEIQIEGANPKVAPGERKKDAFEDAPEKTDDAELPVGEERILPPIDDVAPFETDGDPLEQLQQLEQLIMEIQEKQLDQAEPYIRENGESPTEALVSSVEENTVTFVGETHTIGTANPHRDLFAGSLEGMPEGTQLGIELPSVLQPVFDQFNQSEPGSEFEIPETLEGEFAEESLELLRSVVQHNPDMVNIWMAARDNGIPITAIDNASAVMPDGTPGKAEANASRDEHMKEKIKEMVAGDSDAHVIAYLGSLHGARSTDPDSEPQSAAELLTADEDFQGMGGSIESFHPQIAEGAGIGLALHPLTSRFDEPISVETRDDNENPNPVGELPLFRSPSDNAVHGYGLDSFDNVIVYPPAEPEQDVDKQLYDERKAVIEERAKEIQEMKDRPKDKPDESNDSFFGDNSTGRVSDETREEIDSQGKPVAQSLEEAMETERVVGLDVEQGDWQQHLDFASEAFDALAEGGATHAAFELPPDLQPLLDEFKDSGIVDRTKLPPTAIGDYQAAMIQAAINSGLEPVAIGETSLLDNSQSGEQLQRVNQLLQNSDNKVVLVADARSLSDSADSQNRPSLVQRLEQSGTNVETFNVVTGSDLSQGSAVSDEIIHPVSISTDQAPAVSEFDEFFGGSFSDWDNIIFLK